MTAPKTPGTMRAFRALYEEIERLDVATRWAMARYDQARPALAEVFQVLGWLMMRPADAELVRIAAALIDAIERMTPQVRAVFVRTIFRPDADMKQLQPTYDRLAELVGVIDRRMRDG